MQFYAVSYGRDQCSRGTCCLHVLGRQAQDVSLKLYSLTIQYDIAKDETLVPQAASDKTHLGH
jgi:hypothetical protein